MEYKIQSPLEASGYGDDSPQAAAAAAAAGAGGDQRRIGRYTILKVLGKGGMGEVFKAVDPSNNRFVAIKVLDNEAYTDKDLLRRFEREARAAINLDHPNIAKFFGLEYDNTQRPFIVMEFIEGQPLDKILTSTAEIPFSRHADFIIQTARGLEAAHRRAIIHRDIKPSNLIVGPGDHIKIIDFGLAKSLWDQSMLTSTGMVVGTPRYISPEQGLGRSVDHRSDIYSLGATFYELVTRQCPYDGDTAMAIMLKHINSALIPPYMINPKVPGDINEIICKMMAKDPGERYQDYEPLIRDLESARIHRLAKEKRSSGTSGGIDSHDPTVVYEGVQGDGPAQGRARSPYLTEGLVKIDFSDLPEEPAPSLGKTIAMWAIGALVVGGAAFGLLSARKSNQSGQQSWIGQKIHSFFSKSDSTPRDTNDDKAKKDQENIDLTRGRMEALIPVIIKYRSSGEARASSPRIRDMRDKNKITTAQSTDAWDNDFVISNDGTGGVLIAPGRDGVEGTDDDFRLPLSGNGGTFPKALTAEDLAIKEQTKK